MLGFESTSGWTTSAGSLSSSSQASEGSASLALTTSGYAQLTSVPLTSLGRVGGQLTLDVRPSQSSSWGEVRLIVKAPSLGEYWRDLGSKPLAGVTPNAFHRLEFSLPADLQTKLSSQYSDLSFLITVNAPSGVFAFDRLDLGASPSPPALTNTKYSFSIVLPSGVGIKDVALAAASELKLADRVHVMAGTTPVRVFNATGDTELGADAVVGGVVSGGNAFLRSRTRVSGDVRVGGNITRQDGVVVTGVQLAHQTITTQTLRWVEYPPRATTSVALEPNRARVIVPGAYGSVVIKSSAKLYLPSGKYFFDSLQIEPQAEVVLQDTGGPIFIYIKDSFTHRGTIRGLGAGRPDLLLGYVGTGTVVLEAAFPGTLVAPNGTLRLQPAPTGGHAGAFYAKTLAAEPDVAVTRRPFPWATLFPPDTSNVPPRVMTPSPVVLTATHGYAPDESRPGSANPPSPVTFTIPKLIPVTGGNAGNGAAILTFTEPGGTRVTCQYRGRASSAHPVGTLELARGLYYVFESCSNGLVVGAEAQGTDFNLTINGDSQYPTGQTEAELALGKATCSGRLEPLITPEQSQQMLHGFSWANTQALPETNPEGQPTLYYANIYIQNEEEKKLLKRFFIHHQAKPLFVDELSQYKGKCGSFEHAGDGEGQFVFAVIPGATYNRIRAATSHPDIPANQRVLFRAIALRQAPAAAVHPDGSLRYGPLKQAGFYYMNLRDMPPREALSEELLGNGDPVSALVDAIEFVADVAYSAGTAVVRVLGVVDRWLFGSVALTIDLEVLNRDPAFEKSRPMQYGYYNEAGTVLGGPETLGISGLRVEVLQWAFRPLGVYPTNYYSETGPTGVASLNVGKSSGGLAGDVFARGDSGICIEMKNHAAEMVSGLLPNEVCDFRVAPEFKGFQEDAFIRVQTDDYDAHALAQMTETWAYAASGGHMARRARVLTGHTAAVVSVEGKRGLRQIWTPCLGYSGNTFSMVQLITSGFLPWKRLIADGEIAEGVAATFGVPWYLGRLADSDIVMPRTSNASSSRGIMVHEYGHFLACSLMDEVDPNSLGILTVDVVACGKDIDTDDEARYLTEAFADFITGQVVGGTNYFSPPMATRSGAISFCDGSGICLDDNFRKTDSGESQINRVVTLYHDAFDGTTTRGTAPTNGDSFSLQSSGELCTNGTCFRAAPATYGLDSDEKVMLPASALPVWFMRWIGEANVFNALREKPVMKGLGKTMKDYGYNWCEACEVFANHSALASGGTMQDKFQACLKAPISGYIADEAPEGSGRIRASDCKACPAGTISAPDGKCNACAAGEQVVGNVCSPCAPGQIVSAAGVCTSCAPNQIVLNNACTACAFDQAPDVARTSCLVCPLDVTLDWRAVPDTCEHSAILLTGAPPGDICPDRFLVNVTNLQDVLAYNPESAGLGLFVTSDAASAAQCSAANSHIDTGTLSSSGLAPLAASDAAGLWWTLGGGLCAHQDGSLFITGSDITAGQRSRAIMIKVGSGAGFVPARLRIGDLTQPPSCGPG